MGSDAATISPKRGSIPWRTVSVRRVIVAACSSDAAEPISAIAAVPASIPPCWKAQNDATIQKAWIANDSPRTTLMWRA